MNNRILNTSIAGLWKFLIIDSLAIFLVATLPAISHLLAFPLYHFEPIRIVVLLGLLLSSNKKNAYVLAVIIPFFSFLIAGHPVFCKSLLIILEMTANIWLYSYLHSKKVNVFFAMFSSIIVSKVLYYGAKALFIEVGILNTSIIDTNLWIQLGVMTTIAVVFAIIISKFKPSIK